MRWPALLALALVAAWSVPTPARPGAQGAEAPSATDAPAGGATHAPTSRPPRAATVGCLIGPEQVADIGTPLAGVVAALPVERGDRVKRGQALVVLESPVEQANMGSARARAAIDADVQAARAALELARQRQERSAQLVKDGFVSPLAAEQTRAEYEVARQKLAQALGQRQVQQQEVQVASAQLGQRTLKSPFDGVVVERFVNTAERVEEKPLLRVAKLDPLRVELVVPATRWGSLQQGERIDVVPELPGAVPVAARITRVDPMIDAASNTFRVRLALPNPGHKLPAGARCKAELPGEQPLAGRARPDAAAARDAARAAARGKGAV